LMRPRPIDKPRGKINLVIEQILVPYQSVLFSLALANRFFC